MEREEEEGGWVPLTRAPLVSMTNAFYFTKMYFSSEFKEYIFVGEKLYLGFFCKVKHSGDLTCEIHSTPCQQIQCYTAASDHRLEPSRVFDDRNLRISEYSD